MCTLPTWHCMSTQALAPCLSAPTHSLCPVSLALPYTTTFFCVRLHILVCGLILVMLQAVVLGGVVIVLCILYSQHHVLVRRIREGKHPLTRTCGMSRRQVHAGSAHHETSRQVLNEGMTARDRPVQIYSSIPCNCTDRLPDMPSPSCTHSDGTPRAAITPYAHTLIDQAQVWALGCGVSCIVLPCALSPCALSSCLTCCSCVMLAAHAGDGERGGHTIRGGHRMRCVHTKFQPACLLLHSPSPPPLASPPSPPRR